MVRKFIVCVVVCVVAFFTLAHAVCFAQLDHYARTAASYTQEAEYYQRKTERYRRGTTFARRSLTKDGLPITLSVGY